MSDLAARYGTPSPLRRRGTVLLVVVLSAASLGWLAWTAFFHATPPVESALSSYEIISDNEVTAVVQVSLADSTTVASCRVRALAEDHSTVGELAFEPVDGANRVTVRTERRATSVTLLGCTAPGQPRPR